MQSIVGSPSDLLASEHVDLLAQLVESFLALGHPRLQLLLGSLSSTRDPGVTQLQDRLDVLRPAEQRRVQLQILRYVSTKTRQSTENIFVASTCHFDSFI